ncbi:1004_t:CDS:2 [Diversispora eburnea]|uniref:1004_t:CDS:1 n=1 Tax=Diversispora eburnea TaxID=1213867 RepID=A0A9N9FDL9_9GLOM|nr:1004_t:CDS:2 [Diversispora eburnea]
MRQLEIADENQKNTSKSQKLESIELFSYSSKLHPQSHYTSRYIHTLYGLNDLLEEIKSGKSSGDPVRGLGQTNIEFGIIPFQFAAGILDGLISIFKVLYLGATSRITVSHAEICWSG